MPVRDFGPMSALGQKQTSLSVMACPLCAISGHDNHAAYFASHSHSFFALFTLSQKGQISHSRGHPARCFSSLPVRCAGAFARIFFGSAFLHPSPFRNPRRLIKLFVMPPFMFAYR